MLFFLCIGVHSQIIIIDSVSKKGIAFVEIYSSTGDLIGLTDINGFINEESLKQIKKIKIETLSFNHIIYNELILSKEKLLSSKEIELQKNAINLDEVVLKAKKRMHNFIKLHGFYRSYQLNNDKLKYYTDGIVTYYLPIGTKNKIKNKLHYSRSFVNEKLRENEKRRVNTVSIIMAGLPRPDKRLTSIFLKKENYNLFPENENNFIINENEKQIGIIQLSEEKNLASLKVAFILDDNPVIKKMFKYHSIGNLHNGFAYYKTKNIDSLNLENLLYHKEIRRLKFKHKKDKKYEQIEALHEFFVTEVELVEKIKDKNLTVWFGFNKKGNYDKEYWREFYKHQFFNPLPKSIEMQLGTILVENSDDD